MRLIYQGHKGGSRKKLKNFLFLFGGFFLDFGKSLQEGMSEVDGRGVNASIPETLIFP